MTQKQKGSQVTDKPKSRLPLWIACLLAPLFVLATTGVGAAIGFAIASIIWGLMVNPDPSPQNVANELGA
jgi:hypothetical protein